LKENQTALGWRLVDIHIDWPELDRLAFECPDSVSVEHKKKISVLLKLREPTAFYSVQYITKVGAGRPGGEWITNLAQKFRIQRNKVNRYHCNKLAQSIYYLGTFYEALHQ